MTGKNIGFNSFVKTAGNDHVTFEPSRDPYSEQNRNGIERCASGSYQNYKPY